MFGKSDLSEAGFEQREERVSRKGTYPLEFVEPFTLCLRSTRVGRVEEKGGKGGFRCGTTKIEK